jgi:5-(carboxyamino)imidazole ribonucleotide synthase
VRFDRELSVLAAAGRDGSRVFYPLTENHHRGGILRTSYAPAPGLGGALQAQGEELASRVLDRLGYVGVLAIELFEAGGRLLANEIAPRVHNSGHWTLDGAQASQFENHIRAVTGMPLAPPRVPAPAAMINLIGELPELNAVAAIPGAHIHLYSKAARPGRKLGHVNVTGDDTDAVMETVERVWALLPGEGELPRATGWRHTTSQ